MPRRTRSGRRSPHRAPRTGGSTASVGEPSEASCWSAARARQASGLRSAWPLRRPAAGSVPCLGTRSGPAEAGALGSVRGQPARTPSEIKLAALGCEAIRAIDGLAARGAEGDLGLLAAARARRGEHLARTAIAAPAAAAVTTAARAVAGAAAVAGAPAIAGATAGLTTRCLAAGSAAAATARLTEAALRVELLLARGERELLAAISAAQGLVRVQ